MNKIVLIVSLVILFSSCQETKRVFIASSLDDCQVEATLKCMLYKENPSDEWSYFYERIEGFEYEEGYEYELEVMVIQIANTPSDTSSLNYKLVKIVSKQKEQSIAQQLPLDASKPQDDIMTIHYQALSRGSFFQVTIDKDRIEKTADRSLTNKSTIKCSENDWSTLLALIEKVQIEDLNEIKAPTDKRLFDGAPSAQIKLIYQTQTYSSSSFDHGHPPEEIKPLVNTILSLAESIE